MRRAYGLALAALAACAADDATAPASPPPNDAGCPTCTACPEGFAPAEGGTGCVAIAAAACEPGTRRAIGQTTCAPVGTTACAAGFVRDASGWGCAAVVAAKACTGATRERLGESACVPVGDCNAAFPPANATHFVDGSGVVDATHFQTMASALAAAPAGAVIAVAPGTYAETIAPTKAVTIVGRCAERVVFAPSAPTTKAGVVIQSTSGVVVKAITVRGFGGGGAAVARASATFEDVILEDNATVGALVTDAGGKLRIVGSVVRGTRAAGDEATLFGIAAQTAAVLEIVDSAIADNEMINVGAYDSAKATVMRSVIRSGLSRTSGTNAGRLGAGVYVTEGGDVTVEESAVLDHVSGGLTATAVAGVKAPKLAVRRSVVSGVRASIDKVARGIESTNGATTIIEDTTLSGATQYELLAGGKATLDARNVVTRGTSGAVGLLVDDAAHATIADSAFVGAKQLGIQAQSNSTLDVSGSVVRDVVPGDEHRPGIGYLGFGISVRTRSTMTLDKSWIDRANAVAITTGEATVTVTDSILSDTLPVDGNAGRAIGAERASTIAVRRSSITGSTECGVSLLGGSTLAMEDSTIDGTRLDAMGRFGVGALVVQASTAIFRGTTIRASEGIGLALDVSAVVVHGGTFAKNGVALHAQDGASIVEAEPGPDPTPSTLVVSPETRFVENEARIGSGAVPLPSAEFDLRK